MLCFNKNFCKKCKSIYFAYRLTFSCRIKIRALISRLTKSMHPYNESNTRKIRGKEGKKSEGIGKSMRRERNSPIILLNRNYVYRALPFCSDPSNLSNEINYLKPLALSRGYNPSVVDKALNK